MRTYIVIAVALVKALVDIAVILVLQRWAK
jgi:hypothetical protein